MPAHAALQSSGLASPSISHPKLQQHAASCDPSGDADGVADGEADGAADEGATVGDTLPGAGAAVGATLPSVGAVVGAELPGAGTAVGGAPPGAGAAVGGALPGVGGVVGADEGAAVGGEQDLRRWAVYGKIERASQSGKEHPARGKHTAPSQTMQSQPAMPAHAALQSSGLASPSISHPTLQQHAASCDPSGDTDGVADGEADGAAGEGATVGDTLPGAGAAVGGTLPSVGDAVGDTLPGEGGVVGGALPGVGAVVGGRLQVLTVFGVGTVVGDAVESAGAVVGAAVAGVGEFVGAPVGEMLSGDIVGVAVGETVSGAVVGAPVGAMLSGDVVGAPVGEMLDGDSVGALVGETLSGDAVGASFGGRVGAERERGPAEGPPRRVACPLRHAAAPRVRVADRLRLRLGVRPDVVAVAAVVVLVAVQAVVVHVAAREGGRRRGRRQRGRDTAARLRRPIQRNRWKMASQNGRLEKTGAGPGERPEGRSEAMENWRKARNGIGALRGQAGARDNFFFGSVTVHAEPAQLAGRQPFPPVHRGEAAGGSPGQARPKARQESGYRTPGGRRPALHAAAGRVDAAVKRGGSLVGEELDAAHRVAGRIDGGDARLHRDKRLHLVLGVVQRNRTWWGKGDPNLLDTIGGRKGIWLDSEMLSTITAEMRGSHGTRWPSRKRQPPRDDHLPRAKGETARVRPAYAAAGALARARVAHLDARDTRPGAHADRGDPAADAVVGPEEGGRLSGTHDSYGAHATSATWAGRATALLPNPKTVIEVGAEVPADVADLLRRRAAPRRAGGARRGAEKGAGRRRTKRPRARRGRMTRGGVVSPPTVPAAHCVHGTAPRAAGRMRCASRRRMQRGCERRRRIRGAASGARAAAAAPRRLPHRIAAASDERSRLRQTLTSYKEAIT
eukprot:gene11838-biopygen3847